MKIEKLLKKAITEFTKQNPKAEIRSCFLAEGSGSFRNWSEASFHTDIAFDLHGRMKYRLFNGRGIVKCWASDEFGRGNCPLFRGKRRR